MIVLVKITIILCKDKYIFKIKNRMNYYFKYLKKIKVFFYL